MKKRTSFIVSSTALAGKWGAKAMKEDPQIEKRCPVCNGPLVFAVVYEHGQENAGLYCENCKKTPEEYASEKAEWEAFGKKGRG